MIAARDALPVRRPGCPSCDALKRALAELLHDWSAVTSTADPLVVTGLLAIDVGSLDVMVDGERVAVSATEARLLAALARRVGRTVSHATLLAEVWRTAAFDRQLQVADRHLLRVNLTRLKHRLGPAGSLIRTAYHLGYRLEAVPPGVQLPLVRASARGVRVLGDRWALSHARCCACGTTELRHKARGYCTRCYDHVR